MKMDLTVWGQRGLYALRVSGRVMHRIGTLEPNPNESHKFCQIYMLDEANAVQQRAQHHAMMTGRNVRAGLDQEILQEFERFFRQNNEYAQMFVGAQQRFQQNPNANAINIMQVEGGPDARRYNMPTERHTIAAVFLDEGATPNGRDFWVHQRGQAMPRQVKELEEKFLPMHFPLIHTHGQGGWHPGIWLTARRGGISALDQRGDRPYDGAMPGPNERVTQMDWIAWHLFERFSFASGGKQFSTLLHSGDLFQEYMVDFYVQVETGRLRWIELNQKQIRRESYRGLADAVSMGLAAAEVGTPVILPSSFIGGPRNMTQLYQDAMGFVRVLGSPSYFVTMTCNPKWREIQENLGPGQKASDRPELVVRVFQAKLQALLEDLKKQEMFGEVTGMVHTIEFQKRGLPHARILLMVRSPFRPKTAEDVDQVVSTEIPDAEQDPDLHQVVIDCMLHGHCGSSSPCWKDGRCTKNFPKAFREETSVAQDGYPKYRRREQGFTHRKWRMAASWNSTIRM
jgi:hypothetical protein